MKQRTGKQNVTTAVIQQKQVYVVAWATVLED